MTEIGGHLKELKQAADKTAAAPVGAPPTKDVASSVESSLNRAGGIVDKAESLAKKATGFAETVTTFVARFGPLLLKTCRLIRRRTHRGHGRTRCDLSERSLA